MKKIIVSAMFAILAATAAQAQEQQPRREGPPKGNRSFGMMKQLNLTDEQKAAMKSINETFRKQLEELKKNEDITVKEWKSRMETIRKDHQAKMQGLLTDEQKAGLNKLKTERKEKMQQRGKGFYHKRSMHRGRNFEKMKSDLGLTAEQTEALKKNRDGMREKLKALREDSSLSQEQKKAEMKKFHEQQRESLKSILTEEQLKKLQQHKPHRQKPVQS